MTFIEIFDPGMAHWRRQKELEKVLDQRTDQGEPGHEPVDLDSGSITVVRPAPAQDPTAPAPTDPQG